MSSRMRKLPLLALVLLASIVLAACGDSHSKVSTGTYAGESGKNAPYLDVGPLAYEVQLSRELNPYDLEDKQYLQGLTPEQRKLEVGQEWFGVFIQIYNNGSRPAPTATDFTITDTQENVYTPLAIASGNPFAYHAETLARNSRLPALDTIAANGPTQGALLLFKIQVVSLDNRPLTLKIVDPTDAAQTASAELDV
ncbi:MAG TPA: hypothetical protein VH081_02400 [Solirubrobacteraceae bacterium]|nr:hypothetical protein [Solirubrobacteraceae bacterium]